jgi:glycine/D-amino acid oxidase-like deaminating enzyme/nitrite reductase/ring-hydroxylating ferredoxin subunit
MLINGTNFIEVNSTAEYTNSMKEKSNTSPASRQGGQDRPFWIDSIKPVRFTPLQQDEVAEVVIVGGGIAGISTAYALAKEGRRVIVVERNSVGSGETGHTTAHLSNALDERYSRLEDIFDVNTAKLAAESHTLAIDFIERTVAEENIECDFARVDGYLFLHPSHQIETLEAEMDASRKAGVDTSLTDDIPSIHLPSGPALRFPKQGQFHPLKYIRGLCDAIIRSGGKIFTDTTVTEIREDGVTAGDHRVSAKHIVVCTDTPFNDRFTMHTKQMAYRTYAIGCVVPKNEIQPALWWDTGDENSVWPTSPYHYVRTQPYDETNVLLICGGEDHKTGQSAKEHMEEPARFEKLAEWASQHFPMIRDVAYRWSGQVMEPVDALGFIGQNPGDENVYIVTGDSGHGMTYAAIAAMLIPALLNGEPHPWKEIYSPSRLPVRVLGNYISEVGNMAVQYADYLNGGEIESPRQLANDSGAILRSSGKRLAVYRNFEGRLYAFSAVCPHLGCSVRWNSFEKTFDCPCHGSRFTHLGKVLNGPANEDLKEVQIVDGQWVRS